jgi:hypothetical protein
MPNDTLAEDVQGALKGAADFLRLGHGDERQRAFHLAKLQTLENRLEHEIESRSTNYLSQIDVDEQHEIESKWQQLTNDPKFIQMSTEQKAHQQTFDHLRQTNSGKFPRNISPVLYTLPLILIGVAEWYVNFSTFAATFVPVVAIFGTIIVGAIFAVASHLHGSYLKQLGEILHPSVEGRNMLGRKLALVLATLFLLGAFGTIVSLRYIAISAQLGLGSGDSGPFGQPNSSMVWSRLGPTIVINILIWGLGTLYSWAFHEKVPDLRECYRDLLRTSRCVEKARKPFVNEEKRIGARYARERESNQVAIREYGACLDRVKDTINLFPPATPSPAKAGGLRSVP